MAEDPTQLEMFSLEEEKKKTEKESTGINHNLIISKHLLIYLILGILLLAVVVYIAGVERGKQWKVDKIYRDYIKGEKVENE